jgi:putative ABC transport system permease protein
MLISQYLSSVVESLFVNKIRTALAVLGIVIGIAAIVSLLSIGESNAKQIQSQFEKLGTNLVTLSGQGNNITPKDLKAIQDQNILSIRGISPETSQRIEVTFGRKTKEALIVGATSSYLSVHNTAIQTGAFVSDEGVNKNLKTVVLGPELAKYFFGENGDPIGQKIIINDQNYSVVGVTTAKGGDAFSSPDLNAYVPLSTAQNRLFGTKNLSSVSMSLENSEDTAAAKSDLTALMKIRHKIAGNQEADFQIQDQQEILQTLASVSSSMSNLLTTIAAISLVVGGIGIMNVMLVSVIERTGEIGLRKAVGATNSAIVAQFLGEAVVLTALGGAIGVLCGYGVSVLIFSITSQPFAFSTVAVILSLVMSTGIGLIFGWYPAWKASKLSPIEALRYE